jgi:G3E family GTPase
LPISLDHLLLTAGLLRAKGLMWFRQRRAARYTFHLSGRQRVECVTEGPWDAPPCTQLILIGSDATVLQSLKEVFITRMAQVGVSGGGGPSHAFTG